IGMILCKGKNAVIVEYALRDAAKPMGVAEYRVSPTLPQQLENDLPTSGELAREFPLMSLVQLRTDIERSLRRLAERLGIATEKGGIVPLLRELRQANALPASTEQFEAALGAFNAAAHGHDVSAAATAAATTSGWQFLADLDRRNNQ
ncbi:MAG TPA: PDDEXK nuclease domain-containing protein, partial [Rhodopila sp.]